jgi:hypothetical protein
MCFEKFEKADIVLLKIQNIYILAFFLIRFLINGGNLQFIFLALQSQLF